jgi:hypothetical protein
MTTVCTKKVSALASTALIDDNAGLFDNDGYVVDADSNVFDKNGKFIGRTWEAVRDELTWKMSEAHGVDFFKIDRMLEAGVLKDEDITNEVLSLDFKFVPNPALAPKPWPTPTDGEEDDEELEREIKQAMAEAVAGMVAEDDWDDEDNTL